MLSTIIESQLSMTWNITETNRYLQEIVASNLARGVKLTYFWTKVICELSQTNKKELEFTLDNSNSEGNLVIIVHKATILRDSERIFIAGRFRQMKYPYNGFNSVWLITIRVIQSQNTFY